MTRVRIQKHLSTQGVLSRRKAEAAIKAGLITCNGVIAQLGDSIDPESDTLVLDPSLTNQIYYYIAFNKPSNVWSNCPQNDDKQCTDYLPDHLKQLHTIGRLDKESEGLILLTDDGIFAKTCLDPKKEIPKTYHVWTSQVVTEYDVDELIRPTIQIRGKNLKPIQVRQLTKTHLEMTLTQGKNRQIRRMVSTLGMHVTRLKRTAYGAISLSGIEKGEFRHLTKKEIDDLNSF